MCKQNISFAIIHLQSSVSIYEFKIIILIVHIVTRKRHLYYTKTKTTDSRTLTFVSVRLFAYWDFLLIKFAFQLLIYLEVLLVKRWSYGVTYRLIFVGIPVVLRFTQFFFLDLQQNHIYRAHAPYAKKNIKMVFIIDICFTYNFYIFFVDKVIQK